MNINVDKITAAAQEFYDGMNNKTNSRDHSWEYCYRCFHDARHISKPDIDLLSLNLAFYLASWGMYRGSSFLYERDYKIHIPAIEMILKKDYDVLLDIKFSLLKKKETWDILNALIFELQEYYSGVRKKVNEDIEIKSKVSDTLITKILLGTLGCVPAYDEYFTNGLKKHGMNGTFGHKSISQLIELYEQNQERLEEIRKGFRFEELIYPQMKILDMTFWQLGKPE